MKKIFTAEIDKHQLNLIIIKKSEKIFEIGFSYFEKNEHYIEVNNYNYEDEYVGVKATMTRARYYLQQNFKPYEKLIKEVWNKYDDSCQLKMKFNA